MPVTGITVESGVPASGCPGRAFCSRQSAWVPRPSAPCPTGTEAWTQTHPCPAGPDLRAAFPVLLRSLGCASWRCTQWLSSNLLF